MDFSEETAQEGEHLQVHGKADATASNSESLAHFRHLVLEDADLQKRLSQTADAEAFYLRAAQLGREHGCPVTPAELREAVQSSRRISPPLETNVRPGDLAGWVPASICAEKNLDSLLWHYLGTQSFTDPFYEQTVAKSLYHPFGKLFRRRTPIEVLEKFKEPSPGRRPDGFIFHMSRCGSTLISQMLAALPQNLVISEAPPIDSILRLNLKNPAVTDEKRISLLQGMVGTLGRPRSGLEKHFFIKFDAWSIMDLPLILTAFPGVPWVFVYRNPVEVIVSHMRRKGSQMVPGMIEPELFVLEKSLIPEMPAEEYCARVLAGICRKALEHCDNRHSLLVNYSQLPDAVYTSILDFFGVSSTPDDRKRMIETAEFDAKAPSFYFTSDSESKQREASDRVLKAAQEYVSRLYEQLERTRCKGGKSRDIISPPTSIPSADELPYPRS